MLVIILKSYSIPVANYLFICLCFPLPIIINSNTAFQSFIFTGEHPLHSKSTVKLTV